MIPCASCGIAGVFGPEVQARSIEALPTQLLFIGGALVALSAICFLIERRAARNKKKAVR